MFDSLYFFFFKQKTAYEMRISDWSSDVCSSDLPAVTDHLVDEEPPAQVYLGWADGTRLKVHCCRYPTITEEEKITRIGIPPKQLHFGTSGTMPVQICHCRVHHGMLLASARHVPPSAKPAEIGVHPRCPILRIVEESEIF